VSGSVGRFSRCANLFVLGAFEYANLGITGQSSGCVENLIYALVDLFGLMTKGGIS
jgi:hypothetical protein